MGQTYTTTTPSTTVGRISNPSTSHIVATSQYTYAQTGAETTIIHKNAAGKILAEYEYNYDSAGDLVSETDNGVTTYYQYDDSGQLVGYGNVKQSYDPNGNRTKPGYVTGPDNQLLSDGTWDYTYDKEGNVSAKTNIKTGEKWTYGYDNINEMTSAVLTTAKGIVLVSAQYKYDVFGNRIETDIFTCGQGTEVTRFAYDAWNPNVPSGTGNENWNVWATLNAKDQLTTRYIHGDAVDQVFVQVSATGQAAWYLTDHLGSTRLLVNNHGAVLDKINYDAFGNIVNQSEPGAEPLLLYTGQQFDRASRLEYNRARYYDPGSNRWMSQDPLGFLAGEANLYGYVDNRPLEASDPSGEQGEPLGTQVDYQSTDLSRAAAAYRRAQGIRGTRNVAVFEYRAADGSLRTIARASVRGVNHAERIIARELQGMGIDPSRVTRIYSELQPCNLPGAYCDRFIRGTFPNANVTWSFEYGATVESRRAGVQALTQAVARLGIGASNSPAAAGEAAAGAASPSRAGVLSRLRNAANMRVPVPGAVANAASRAGRLLRAGGRIAGRALGPASVALAALELKRDFDWANSVVGLTRELDALETALKADFQEIFRGSYEGATMRLVRGAGSRYPYTREELQGLIRYWMILTRLVNDLPDGWYAWSMQTIAKRDLRIRLSIVEGLLRDMDPGD